MNKEEAKKELSKLIFELGFEDNVDDRVCALNMAIQALSQEPTDDATLKDIFCMGCEYKEQEPCTDAVSRQAVLDGLRGCICDEWVKTLFATMVKQLPSVNPQPCDDAISREAVIKKLIEQPAQVYIDKTDYQQGYIDGVNQMVKELKVEQQKPIECDDAISRDAVCEIISDIRDCISVEGYWAILERLKKLPPVTQKSETVTEFADRCRECGARYGKLLEQKSGKWIPVSERLPELKLHNGGLGIGDFYCSDAVLICTNEPVDDLGKVFIGYYEADYGWADFDASVSNPINAVAWMPLPEPYMVEPQESEVRNEMSVSDKSNS